MDIPEWAQKPAIEYGALAGAVAVLYIFWLVARKVVKWGFFVLYALVGFGVLMAAGKALGQEQTVPVCVAGGIAFAIACMAIRAKIFRIVSAVFVLVAGGWLAHYVSDSVRDHASTRGGLRHTENLRLDTYASTRPGLTFRIPRE